MENVRLPGWLWIVVLVGGPLLAVWLQEYFGATGWAAPVAGLLAIVVAVAKAIQEFQREGEPAAPQPQILPEDVSAREGVSVTHLPEPEPQRGYWRRVLQG